MVKSDAVLIIIGLALVALVLHEGANLVGATGSAAEKIGGTVGGVTSWSPLSWLSNLLSPGGSAETNNYAAPPVNVAPSDVFGGP